MFKCGEKFTVENITVDVEIVGVFPKGQNSDGYNYYVATVNGEKMKVKESFLTMLKEAKKETQKEVKNGRRK